MKEGAKVKNAESRRKDFEDKELEKKRKMEEKREDRREEKRSRNVEGGGASSADPPSAYRQPHYKVQMRRWRSQILR